MFYNHDILTSKKHGVATIWLVATLGSRSTLKKVTRRAILDVKITDACQTIVAPEAPMALRLQGSLLYGVSRVFSQQCGYILSDAQSLHEKVRATSAMINSMQVDHNVATARADQLNLQDDPDFDLNFNLCFDLSAFGLPANSQEFSTISPRTVSSSQASLLVDEAVAAQEEEMGLELPSLDTPTHEYADFAIQSDPRTSSVIGSAPSNWPGSRLGEPAIYDNSDFQITGDGDIMIHGEDELALSTGYATDHASAEAVQHETAAGTISQDEFQQITTDMEYVPLVFDDPDEVPGLMIDEGGPEAYEVSGLPVTPTPDEQALVEVIPAEEEDEMNVITRVPQQRKRRAAVSLMPDHPAELNNSQLTAWTTNYTATMIARQNELVNRRAFSQAKQNAKLWVLDQGIGGNQVNFGTDVSSHPFAVFSGQALLDSLSQKGPVAGRKRSSSEIDDEDTADGKDRRVRHKDDEQQEPRSENLQPTADDDDDDGLLLPQDDYPESEIGRRGGSSLKDQPSQMPWNLSSRHGSVRTYGSGLQAMSSSIGGIHSTGIGPPSVTGRRTSRLTSASPLVGKGRAPQQRDSAEIRDDMSMNDIDVDNYDDLDLHLTGNSGDDFQLPNLDPIVFASTTAQSVQQTAAGLEKEANNFLEFLRASIQDATGDQGAEQYGGGSLHHISFEVLLPPNQSSKNVAAQGMLHTLTLATRSLIEVEQSDAYGEIMLSIIAHG